MSRGHPDGSLSAKAHPSGSLSSAAHPDGTLSAKAHPAGTLVTRTHPPKAGGAAAAGDAFQQVVEGSTAGGTSLACWWSPNGADAGNLSTGDVAMAVMNDGVTNPAIKARVKDAGDWKIVADNIGTVTSLTSAVEANEQRRVESPYEDSFCGIDNSVSLDSDLDEILGGDDTVLSSGFVFFKPAVNASSIYQDILIFRGTDASGQTSNFANNTFSIRYIQSSSKPAVSFGLVGSFSNITILQDTFTADRWWYMAWRQTDRDGTDSDFSMYFIPLDGSTAWGGAVTDTAAFSVAYGTGLTFGHESSHNADDYDGWRWGPIGLFKGDIGVGTEGTTLRTIFEAIQ